MKSGIRNVDKSGNSAPISSQKAKKRLEDYKAAAKPDDKSQKLDGKVLYFMEGGLRHGRVPIAHGAYRSVVQENEDLKEQNEHLKQTNEILIEENGVNREISEADLLNRLANIDARKHQGTGSSHAGSHPDDLNNNGNDTEYSGEDNDDMPGGNGRDDMRGDNDCSDMDEDISGGEEMED
ncbi:hypothetical protein EJB05_35116, partial [Eragrostis curvula]